MNIQEDKYKDCMKKHRIQDQHHGKCGPQKDFTYYCPIGKKTIPNILTMKTKDRRCVEQTINGKKVKRCALFVSSYEVTHGSVPIYGKWWGQAQYDSPVYETIKKECKKKTNVFLFYRIQIFINY